MTTVFRLTFLFILATFPTSTQAVKSNLFDQGVQLRTAPLQKVLETAIKAFAACEMNLKENPDLEDFQTNFEVINTTYEGLYQKIQRNQSLLFDFMELKQTDQIKEKITTIQNLFTRFEQAISANNPLCQLLDVKKREHNSLEQVLAQFVQNKHHCNALIQRNIENLEALWSIQNADNNVDIVMQPDVTDDEKLAQDLQLKLNLELMHEREALEQDAKKKPHVDDFSNREIIGYQPNQEILVEPEMLVTCQGAQKGGASIFSQATNDAQFVAILKEVINSVDITQNLDQRLFDRLMAQAPTNFSMLMNREIGRTHWYDVMLHNFSEPSMLSYAHYFPECLMVGSEVSVATLEEHQESVNHITQLADGGLASCSDNHKIKLWDLNTKKCVATFEEHQNWVNQLTQLADGRLVSCSDYKIIKIWDLNTKKCVATLEGHRNSVNHITQLTDDRLASCSDDKTIKIWNLNTKKCVATLKEHEGFVLHLTQLADGKLASCSADKTIKIWDLNTNTCVATLKEHKNWVRHITQLADSRLASCSYDNTIKLWDLNTNRCVTTLEEHEGWVRHITQLADGRLISCSSDNTIKLWDLNTNTCVTTLKEHSHWVRHITQLADGRLASCSNDRTIKLWDLYAKLSFEQIALVVKLERCLQQDAVYLGDGWHEIFETLPRYFQNHFEAIVQERI